MSVHLSRSVRITIWLQAVAAAVGVVGATLWLESDLLAGVSASYPLRLGVAFGLTQLLAAGAISVQLVGSKWLTRLDRQRSTRDAPPIRAALMAHALGENRTREITRQHQRHPRVFEQTIVELLSLVDGTPRERLTQVAEQLGVDDRWLSELAFECCSSPCGGCQGAWIRPDAPNTSGAAQSTGRRLRGRSTDRRACAVSARPSPRSRARAGVRGAATALEPGHSRPRDATVCCGSHETRDSRGTGHGRTRPIERRAAVHEALASLAVTQRSQASSRPFRLSRSSPSL